MCRRSLAAFAALVVLSSAAAAADRAASLVRVSGHGVVRVVPDRVVIDIVIMTTDDDLIRVRENSDQDARKILALAKKHGVDDTGFEVSRLELSLDYNEQLRRQIYQVDRDATLRLDNLAKLNALLSDLLNEQDFRVVGIKFATTKARLHEFEARSRAVADAKEKAKHLAELSGLKLGNAREIRVVSESQSPFVISVIPVVGSVEPRNGRGIQRDSTRAARDAPRGTNLRFIAFQQADGAAKADAQPFGLGMIEISSDIDVDFELAE